MWCCSDEFHSQQSKCSTSSLCKEPVRFLSLQHCANRYPLFAPPDTHLPPLSTAESLLVEKKLIGSLILWLLLQPLERTGGSVEGERRVGTDYVQAPNSLPVGSRWAAHVPPEDESSPPGGPSTWLFLFPGNSPLKPRLKTALAMLVWGASPWWSYILPPFLHSVPFCRALWIILLA